MARVVTSVAVGAPDDPLPVPVAPIAPEPFVPDVSTPVKLITVMDAATDCDSVAVTVTALKGFAENVLQISAVPFCVFVRLARTHVRLPDDIPVTVILWPVALSVEMNAKSSSFPDVVEIGDDAIVVLAFELFVETVTSMPIAAEAVPANSISKASPSNRQVFLGAIALQTEVELNIVFLVDSVVFLVKVKRNSVRFPNQAQSLRVRLKSADNIPIDVALNRLLLT